MEARLLRAWFALVLVSIVATETWGANYRTEHFLVTAPTAGLAKEIGDVAEAYRRDLAQEWLGQPLGPWRDICPIVAQVHPGMGAGGATSFMFQNNQPFGWQMSVQGSRERILDSVLPHEITHTVFATYFGRPLPRWADEGACTTVEHESERSKQERLLYEFLTTDRGIAFNRMFAMTEYPSDIIPLYSQGYSLARYLIAQGGKQKFLAYLRDGMNSNNWTAATGQHYGYQNLSELQLTWLDWVRSGQPLPPTAAPAVLVADNRAIRKPTRSAENRSTPATNGDPFSAPGVGTAEANSANVAPAAGTPSANLSATPPAYSLGAVRRDDALGADGSWYASHRDRGESDTPADGQRGAAPSLSAALATSDTTRATQPQARLRSSMSRPQDIQGVRETVLEWGRPEPFRNPALLGRNPATNVMR